MTTSDREMRRKMARQLGPRADDLFRDTKQLHKEFKGGDRLAPFECCSLWREAGLPVSTLPDWVLDYLLKIAADYYAAGPHDVTPRDFLDMPPEERQKKLPSLDKIAGLSGTQGRPSPWSWRAEHARDAYMAALLEKLKRWAQEGGMPSPLATKMERRARQNRWRKRNGESDEPDDSVNTVPILDAHGRLRSEVQIDVARAFHVGGYSGDWNKSRTVRRRTR